MTEHEETQLQGNGDLAEHALDCLSTDEDEQDLCRTCQYMEQEADIVTAMDPTQAVTAGPTTATTESEPVQASTSDSA